MILSKIFSFFKRRKFIPEVENVFDEEIFEIKPPEVSPEKWKLIKEVGTRGYLLKSQYKKYKEIEEFLEKHESGKFYVLNEKAIELINYTSQVKNLEEKILKFHNEITSNMKITKKRKLIPYLNKLGRICQKIYLICEDDVLRRVALDIISQINETSYSIRVYHMGKRAIYKNLYKLRNFTGEIKEEFNEFLKLHKYF